MKVSAQTIATFDNLLQTLNTIGIEKVIIEPGKIRAIDERKTVGTITDQNVPDFDGNVVAVSRVKTLKDRLNLAKAQGDVAINATKSDKEATITMLEVSAGKSKTQFRCAAPEALKVPKTFNDKAAYELVISSKQIPLIAQADATMASDGITIASKNGSTVSIELADTSKDLFVFELDNPATAINGTTAGSFVHKYTSKALLSLLKEAAKTSATDDVKITIGAQGILFVDVNGYKFFTLPQA